MSHRHVSLLSVCWRRAIQLELCQTAQRVLPLICYPYQETIKIVEMRHVPSRLNSAERYLRIYITHVVIVAQNGLVRKMGTLSEYTGENFGELRVRNA
jgi:hypothetical protein